MVKANFLNNGLDIKIHGKKLCQTREKIDKVLFPIRLLVGKI